MRAAQFIRNHIVGNAKKPCGKESIAELCQSLHSLEKNVAGGVFSGGLVAQPRIRKAINRIRITLV